MGEILQHLFQRSAKVVFYNGQMTELYQRQTVNKRAPNPDYKGHIFRGGTAATYVPPFTLTSRAFGAGIHTTNRTRADSRVGMTAPWAMPRPCEEFVRKGEGEPQL